MSLKIAHIVSTFPPYYGGMGNVVFETAGALSRLGHSVQVFTPDYYDASEIKSSDVKPEEKHSEHLQNTIETVKRIKPSISYGNAARISDIIKELDAFDIIHLHYPFFGTAEIVARWKKRNPEKKLVITYHMDTRAPGWKGALFALYNFWYLPKILANADACVGATFDYIALSDAGAHFRSHPDLWHEIPFGVDVERFAPREKSLKLLQDLSFSPDIPTILFVGGMDKAHFFKGVMVLLQALLILKMQNTSFQAILVGDGDDRLNFENHVNNYGLGKMARFVGRVDQADLPVYYNASDLLVLPSTTRGEAFGMVLLEAFASGVPVVASDLPGVRTVAELAGLTVVPNNPTELAKIIAEYFSKDTNQAEWREQARSVALEKFQWDIVAQKLDSVYQNLV